MSKRKPVKSKMPKRDETRVPEITSLRLGDLRTELEREAETQTRTLSSLIKHYLKRGLEADRGQQEANAA
jgi:hypothetical protein